jgi:hypothetical protein
VLAPRYPRTDFPQQGWLAKAPLNLYESDKGYGWYRPTQSENEEPRPRAACQRRIRVYYDTQPASVWFTTLPAGFDPSQQNWFISSERIAARKYRYDLDAHRLGAVQFQSWSIPSERPSRKRLVRDTQPNLSWIVPSVIFDPQLWPATQISSERLRDVKPYRYDLDGHRLGTVGFTSWSIDSQRTTSRSYRLHEQSNVSWIFQNLTAQFDPSTQPWSQYSERTGQKKRSYLQWRTVPTGIGTPTEFDPRTFNWIIDSQRTAARSYRIIDPVTVDWIFPTLAAFDPSTQPWKIDSERYRTPARRRDSGLSDVSWIFPNLPAFDAAQFPWSISSERIRPKLQHDVRWRARPSGFSVPVTAFDQATVNWFIESARIAARRYRIIDNINTAWIFPTLPAFDPSIFNWAIESRRIGPKPKNYVQWRTTPTGLGTPTPVFDPSTGIWTIRGERTEKRVYWTSQLPDIGWLFQSIPAFDPSTQPWIQLSERLRAVNRYRYDLDAHRLGLVRFDSWAIQSERPSKIRRAIATQPQFSWLVPSVIFDPQLWPATSIDSQRKWTRSLLQRHINPDNAWIFQNIGAFDPATINWLIESRRVWPKPRNYVQWRTTPTGFGTPPPAFDPATGLWTISSFVPNRTRRTRDTVLQPAWFVPSVIFDPTLYPATAIPSYRHWVKKRGLWHPDVDNAWIFTNIPAPFDPQNMAWSIPDRRLDKFNRRSQQWQYDPDFGWIYVNPLPPVVPPPTINYQGDGKKRRRKKKKFFDLFSEIEQTIRTTIAGPVSVEDLPRASVGSQPVPYESSELDRLFAEAAEYEDLSIRVEHLRRDLSAYQALREQQMIEDDDDDMWILM